MAFIGRVVGPTTPGYIIISNGKEVLAAILKLICNKCGWTGNGAEAIVEKNNVVCCPKCNRAVEVDESEG